MGKLRRHNHVNAPESPQPDDNTRMKPTLIIVHTEQFGYHVDSYYHSKLLSGEFNVRCITWDHGLPRMSLPGVEVHYVPRHGGFARVPRFVNSVRSLAARSAKPLVMVKYMPVMAALLRLAMGRYPMVLDIRTGSVAPHPGVRKLSNLLLRAECTLYRHITIISASLAQMLGLSKRARLLPLGAVEISSCPKRFDNLRLVYVGTLYNRNIDRALRGFAAFCADSAADARLTIVGGGPGAEQQQLQALTAELGVQEKVRILGPVPHDQLRPIFDEHNTGLSFVPLTPYYDVQPPTKTFEYLLSGMPVLATATQENSRVVDAHNGVLTEDSAAGVKHGLEVLWQRRGQYDSNVIRRGAERHLWPNIVRNLAEYLRGVQAARYPA